MVAADLTFRPVVEADTELLFRVYAGTRQAEIASAPWTESQKEAFLRSQFRLQQQQYRSNHPEADFMLILALGEAVGRLYVDRRGDPLFLIDIALLPECRGRGLGTRILRGLVEEALETGRSIVLHVAKTNVAAIRLYCRLGFTRVEELDPYDRMEWRPVERSKPETGPPR